MQRSCTVNGTTVRATTCMTVEAMLAPTRTNHVCKVQPTSNSMISHNPCHVQATAPEVQATIEAICSSLWYTTLYITAWIHPKKIPKSKLSLTLIEYTKHFCIIIDDQTTCTWVSTKSTHLLFHRF